MKAVAVILVLALIAAVAGVGYLYFTSNLEVSFDSVAAVDPLTQPDDFDSLRASLDAGTFIGTRFDASPLPAAENCLWYTWNLRLANKSFLQADAVEVQVTPMEGDLLQPGSASEYVLPPRSSGTLSVSMLTSRSMHSVREAIVTWYVWGLPFSARLTLGK